MASARAEHFAEDQEGRRGKPPKARPDFDELPGEQRSEVEASFRSGLSPEDQGFVGGLGEAERAALLRDFWLTRPAEDPPAHVMARFKAGKAAAAELRAAAGGEGGTLVERAGPDASEAGEGAFVCTGQAVQGK